MVTLIVTVFMASLLGSMHCAGMCGPFAVIASASQASGRTPRWKLSGFYNFGRFLTYVTLGALAGVVGATLNLGGSLVGLQQIATLSAGFAMIVFGSIALLRILGVRVPFIALPKFVTRLLGKGHQVSKGLSPGPRATLIGMLTTFMPCGWLYAFVITAAGTGSPLNGALVMATFWSATLPVMVALGVGVQEILGKSRRWVPHVTAVVVVLVGFYTVTHRALADISQMKNGVESDLSKNVEQVQNLENTELPCCQTDDD